MAIKERIVGGWHRVRVAPLSVTPMDAHLAAAKVADRGLRVLLSSALLVMNAFRRGDPGLLHRPVAAVLHNKPSFCLGPCDG